MKQKTPFHLRKNSIGKTPEEIKAQRRAHDKERAEKIRLKKLRRDPAVQREIAWLKRTQGHDKYCIKQYPEGQFSESYKDRHKIASDYKIKPPPFVPKVIVRKKQTL